MKKLFACLLALMLTLSLTACSLAEQPAAVRLAALKGPTATGWCRRSYAPTTKRRLRETESKGCVFDVS